MSEWGWWLNQLRPNAILLRQGELKRCGLILEGIETEQQLRYWQSRGVRLFQGYLFKTAR